MLPLALDAQFGTPYPRSAGFDTDMDLEGGSSSVHLDDYIEWNPSGVTPQVFPLVLDTRLLWLL